jgi:hypothetical protein
VLCQILVGWLCVRLDLVNDVYHWKHVGQTGRLESLSPFFIDRLANLSRLCRSLVYVRVGRVDLTHQFRLK